MEPADIQRKQRKHELLTYIQVALFTIIVLVMPAILFYSLAQR